MTFMRLFEKKKKNGDYFIEMIKTLTETSANVSHLKEGFDDHVKAGRVQRTEDKEWQKTVNQKMNECPKSDQIDTLQDDISDIKSDKKGIKMIWKFAVGGLGVIAVTLGIFWRLGLL